MDSEVVIKKLQKRIPFNENIFESDNGYINILTCLYEDAKHIFLSIRYPFEEDYSELDIPIKWENWILRCCVELYNISGNQGVKSYSENGLSWSKQTDGISVSLINEITPKAGTPKRSALESESDSNV